MRHAASACALSPNTPRKNGEGVIYVIGIGIGIWLALSALLAVFLGKAIRRMAD